MSDEKSVQPDANAPTPETTETTETPETTEQLTPQTDTLPDEPVSDVERLKTEYADIVQQNKEIKESNTKLEGQLKEGLAYISRTRNPEKAPDAPRPQKTMEDYLGDLDKIVDTDFENDPNKGLKKAIRKIVTDVAWDRDAERAEAAKNVEAAEERAFKKMLALNPELNKTLKEIEKLDEECPDLQGLSYERKVEFINLKKSGATKRDADVRDKISREVGIAGGVGGSNVRSKKEDIASWVNDPQVVKEAQGIFSTKQELANWADPDKAKAMYEKSKLKQG